MIGKKQHIFKIIFIQRDTIYEIYAKQVTESDMYGFVVVEDILFGEKSQLVLDPTEERLKNQFIDVKRTYIPIHTVLRIDEVEKEGTPRMTPLPPGSNNVSPFPSPLNPHDGNR